VATPVSTPEAEAGLRVTAVAWVGYKARLYLKKKKPIQTNNNNKNSARKISSISSNSPEEKAQVFQ
jgi:hypothetical protein